MNYKVYILTEQECGRRSDQYSQTAWSEDATSTGHRQSGGRPKNWAFKGAIPESHPFIVWWEGCWPCLSCQQVISNPALKFWGKRFKTMMPWHNFSLTWKALGSHPPSGAWRAGAHSSSLLEPITMSKDGTTGWMSKRANQTSASTCSLTFCIRKHSFSHFRRITFYSVFLQKTKKKWILYICQMCAYNLHDMSNGINRSFDSFSKQLQIAWIGNIHFMFHSPGGDIA